MPFAYELLLNVQSHVYEDQFGKQLMLGIKLQLAIQIKLLPCEIMLEIMQIKRHIGKVIFL